jgi:hypothetical protein
MKLYFTMLLLLFCTAVCRAQHADSMGDNPPKFADSLMVAKDEPVLPKVRPAPLWRPAAEVLLCQAVPFTFNYIFTEPNISKISFKSIGDNMNFKNWEFDDDKFLTNQFAHPYHGNLYYNAFRSNGYTFWQSVPATFVGSLVWEVAGEINPASYNDMVNTTFGGIALGEMTYRLAGLIINKRKSGRKRRMQELLATVVNPVNGFNRLVDRKWNEVAATDPEDSLFVDLSVDVGARFVNKYANQLFPGARTEVFGSIKMKYGNPFKNYKLPFDNFYILMELGNADSAKLNSLWGQGSLWGKIVGGGEHSLKMLRLTMNYDFHKNTAFEYGGQSLLLTWLAHFNLGKNFTINTELGGGVILLSASLDKHRVYKEARNYTYGSGLALYSTGEVIYKDRLSYRLNFRSGWTGTISGSSSNKFLHLAFTEIKYRIYKHLTVSGSWGNFQLVGYYPGYDSTDDVYPFLRCTLGYKIIF